MSTRRAHVLLPEDLLREIDAIVGPRGRSAFLVETARNEVRRPIFKQDDKTEGEKHKQENPEQSSNEAHARTLTYSVPAVNDCR